MNNNNTIPSSRPSAPPSPPKPSAEQGHAKGVLERLVDAHPKLAYALSDWLQSGTRGHFQINRADKNGKYIWNNLISDRE